MDSPYKRHTPHHHSLLAQLAGWARPAERETGSEGFDSQFDDALDFLPLPAWAWRGGQQYFNQLWRDSFSAGTSPLEQLHQGRWVHPADQPKAAEQWAQAQRCEQPLQLELRLRLKSGNYRWFALHARPQRPAQLAGAQWCVTCTDIHEQVAPHEALANNLSMQKDMLDASVDCIKWLQNDGTLTHMNKSGCLALGVPTQCPS